MARRGRGSEKAAEAAPGEAGPSAGGSALAARIGWAALCAGVFCAVALAIAWRALDGAWLSDDFIYIINNGYVHGLSLENVRALLDPWGPPTVYTLNYAPVHLLAHAAEWELWQDSTRGYHVVNALAHGLTAALLVPYFRRSGIQPLAAVLGAAFFLVHPANVETVAWIFQLKTIVALAFGLAAIMLHERHPAWGTLLFTLAILTKITAVFALPVALVEAWGRQLRGQGGAARWGWLAFWAAIMLLVMVPEKAAFDRQADVRIVISPDHLVHARTVVAIAMRYLWMALTARNVATFQEPPPAVSWLDPWWVSGVAVLVILGWRTLATLRRGDPEAAYWTFAAAAFAPVSQIFPFIFPMGDRYLYTILPGLIGGVLLAGRALWNAARLRWIDRLGEPASVTALLQQAAVVAAVVWIGIFAWQSQQRSAVFVDMRAMMIDSALSFPDGMQANLLKGHQAAERNDAVAAARYFQRAVDLGFSDLAALMDHPGLASVRDQPAFRSVLLDLARRDVERLSRHEDPTQGELIMLHVAYMVRGERDEARRVLEQAIAIGGPLTDYARSLLDGMEPKSR